MIQGTSCEKAFEKDAPSACHPRASAFTRRSRWDRLLPRRQSEVTFSARWRWSGSAAGDELARRPSQSDVSRSRTTARRAVEFRFGRRSRALAFHRGDTSLERLSRPVRRPPTRLASVCFPSGSRAHRHPIPTFVIPRDVTSRPSRDPFPPRASEPAGETSQWRDSTWTSPRCDSAPTVARLHDVERTRTDARLRRAGLGRGFGSGEDVHEVPSTSLQITPGYMVRMNRKTNSATARLKQDYLRLKKDPVPYVLAEPVPSNILEWQVWFKWATCRSLACEMLM